jgi:hypothetical protein
MSNPSQAKLDRLLSAARGSAPDTSRLEYTFETRLLARLAEEKNTSIFAQAWRLCPYFAAIAIAAAMWSRTTTAHIQSDAPILAEANRTSEEQMLVAFMTGDSAQR